jgi:hypothetical protein
MGEKVEKQLKIGENLRPKNSANRKKNLKKTDP